MSRRYAVLVLSFAALLLLAVPAWAAEISIGADGASPRQVQADVGESIVWTNDSDQTVTLAGEQPRWSSGPLEPGGTFSLSFDEPGTYAYTSDDDRISGEVVVVGDDEEPGADGGEDAEAGPGEARLPATGAPAGAAGAVAAALLAAGAALTAAARRRGPATGR